MLMRRNFFAIKHFQLSWVHKVFCVAGNNILIGVDEQMSTFEVGLMYLANKQQSHNVN